MVRSFAAGFIATATLVSSNPLIAQRPSVAGAAAPTSVLRVSAALVDGDLQVRPVPLHALRITGRSDTILVRTGVDGLASITLPPGHYAVSSVAAAAFQGTQYSWNLEVTLDAGTSTDLALTNDNAAVESQATPADASPSHLDPAAALFSRFQKSVFRIQAGLGHGTGFLADTLGGVIITNAHVVEGAESDGVSVVVDSATRVRAQVLARDSETDIAILRLAPQYVLDRTKMRLQDRSGRAPVEPGERLVAMGYPLNQELAVTAGIASSVRAGAIISDVNINPGNSGGPLLNSGGEVVAVNTFGDFTPQGGPGISGSILIARAGPSLARAAVELHRTAAPPAVLMPTMPSDQLDIAAVKAYAEAADPRIHKNFAGIDVGGFEVTVQTPFQTFVAAKAFENDVAKDRKKRERLAGLPENERYSAVREYRDWGEYVGSPTAPVVSLAIIPKIGETGGSLFTRIMLGPNLKATYKFKGDVRGAILFRNGISVEPIKGGHAPTKVYVDNQWVSLKDVADQGFYVYDVEAFRPDSMGAPPQLVIAIRDLKSPNKLKCRELRREVVAQAWNDFEVFYVERRPHAGFLRADPRAAGSRQPAYSAGAMRQDCDWSY